MNIKELQKLCHEIAIEHGFWDTERNKGELIALMHSELSEALEFLRHNNPVSDHIPPYSGVEEELADTIIRIFDFAESENIDLEKVITAKCYYNKMRERKHGKQF